MDARVFRIASHGAEAALARVVKEALVLLHFFQDVRGFHFFGDEQNLPARQSFSQCDVAAMARQPRREGEADDDGREPDDLVGRLPEERGQGAAAKEDVDEVVFNRGAPRQKRAFAVLRAPAAVAPEENVNHVARLDEHEQRRVEGGDDEFGEETLRDHAHAAKTFAQRREDEYAQPAGNFRQEQKA